MRRSNFLLLFTLLFAASVSAEEAVQTVEEFLATPSGRVSVDFVSTPVSDVAYFVTEQTGIGFIFSLTDDAVINWSQMGMARSELLTNFGHALATVHLGCYPVDAGGKLYWIKLLESRKPRYERLSSIVKGDQVYLNDGDDFFTRDDSPYELQELSGVWYALKP